MGKYKAVLFDLDGTVLKSKRDIAIATNETIKYIGGHQLDETLIASFVGRGVKPLILDAMKKAGLEHKIEEAFDYFQKYYFEHCLDHTVLFDGVADLLENLKNQSVKMAVWTNKPQEYTDRIISGLHLNKYFEVVLGAGNGYPSKPEVDGTNFILNNLKVKPEDSLMIGDTVTDFNTAKNVGMDVAIFYGGYANRSEIDQLDQNEFIGFQSFRELEKILI